MELFFTSDIQGSKAIFGPDESRHIAKAMRKRIGDPICFTNGQGILFQGILESESRKGMIVEITSSEAQTKNWRGTLIMALAPTKNFNRIEWAIERMIEMGIDEIVPLETERSERKAWKMNRLQRIAISALKQSQQFQLPVLHDPISFKSWVENARADVEYYIGHCEEGKKVPLKDIQVAERNVCFCIGPEGDFSHTEIGMAVEQGMTAISLGQNRLRTETAALKVATHFSVQNDM